MDITGVWLKVVAISSYPGRLKAIALRLEAIALKWPARAPHVEIQTDRPLLAEGGERPLEG